MALSVGLPVTGLLGLMLVPGTMSGLTFFALAAAIMGTGLVAMNTWRNGQPTRSVAHVLNDAEARLPRE